MGWLYGVHSVRGATLEGPTCGLPPVRRAARSPSDQKPTFSPCCQTRKILSTFLENNASCSVWENSEMIVA